MAFPEEPRDIEVELHVGGDWRDISSDVYQRDGIEITRGRSNEQAKMAPSRATMTINNRSGDYSSRNPLGRHFGELSRNTPLRVSVGIGSDGFDRTATASWGTATDGLGAWQLAGSTGAALADFTVSGGQGRMAVTAANGLRYAFVDDAPMADVDVAATVDILGVTAATGASLSAAILFRGGPDVNTYHQARLSITTAGAVTVVIADTNLTIIAATETVPGLTWTGQPLRIRLQAEGRAVRAKVWDPTGPEPAGWHTEGDDLIDPVAGWVGLYSFVPTGNTNTLPVLFAFDDLQVRSPRYAGEVSEWPAKTDTTGEDAYVEIEAAGILRRLGQGSSPLASPLHRYLTTTLAPVEYWPLEEGKLSARGASVTGGGHSVFTANSSFTPPAGRITWAADDDLPGGLQAPSWTEGGVLALPVRSARHEPAGEYAITWAMRYYARSGAQLTFRTDGANAFRFFFVFYDDGLVTVTPVTSTPGATTVMSYRFPSITDYDGVWNHYGIYVDQTGAGVEWGLYVNGTFVDNYGATPGLRGRPAWLEFIAPISTEDELAVGHVTVHDGGFAISGLAAAARGFAGETAAERMQRLCTEEAIPFTVHGDPDETTTVGAQRADGIVALLTDAADADQGTLYETRGTLGLAYRPLSSMLNQDPDATISYTAGELAPPFEPTDDDQLLRNDVAAERVDGGTYRVEQATGPLSVLAPADGGVGRYDDSVEVNVETDTQLPDAAGWRVHLGTVDEARFPRIKVNLANPGVAANTTLSKAMLAVDVESQVTVTDCESIGFYDDVRQVVRGYKERLNAFEHELELNCSPASPLDVLVLDDATAKLSSSASALASGVTSSGTSLSVASPNELWTTTPADMPIPIVIGGEEMSVTAISGSSSPQTFTVTRAVNGVVKAHSAGATVRLARRATVTP